MIYSIFIFRRDLRLNDNTSLINMMKNYNNIIPIFIFTPEQISNNKYKSDNAIQFMIDSLIDLDSNLKKYKSKLHLFYGDNIQIINKIIKEKNIEAIGTNMDYTPYALARDKKIKNLCKRSGIEFIYDEDYLLDNIGTFNKKNGEPYMVYTPFKNNAKKFNIRKVDNTKPKNLSKVSLSGIKSFSFFENFYDYNDDILVEGGRKNALKILNNTRKFKTYNTKRNDADYETTQLSAYIKFGNVSIREVYHKFKSVLGNNNQLIDQIIWREFYYYIVYHNPSMLKGKVLNKKYITTTGKPKIKWVKNKKLFDAWCNGETGYPIVDAGMRQLNETGYMHNRLRLITSNFLHRLLGINWRDGERYFANQLTDYDPAVNNGNWQWIASVGVDTKPYSQRVFNPWTQSEKADKNAKYIKRWIPSLKDVKPNHLHKWDKYCEEYDLDEIDYYDPIVDYEEARKKSLEMYKKAL